MVIRGPVQLRNGLIALGSSPATRPTPSFLSAPRNSPRRSQGPQRLGTAAALRLREAASLARAAGLAAAAGGVMESAVEELMPRLLPVGDCDLPDDFDPTVPPRTPQEYLRRVQ